MKPWDAHAGKSKRGHANFALQARGLPVLALMLACVLVVTALAYADSLRESSGALIDFAQEQAVLAQAVAADLASRLATVERDTLALSEVDWLGGRLPPSLESRKNILKQDPLGAIMEGLGTIERPMSLALLLRPPDGALRATDGRVVDAPPISRAIDEGAPYVRLSREDAGRLGLPARTAIAGISTVVRGAAGRWTVVVIATAQRERDREHWARIRLALTVFAVTVLVAGLGGLALRKQRKQLMVEHELNLSRVQQKQEARLTRAARAATLGTLAMGIAHEVSTPLGVIFGRAEQLAAQLGGVQTQGDAVRVILAQCQRIDQVIRGLLRLARGESPQLNDITAQQLVRSAVDLVSHKFVQANVTIDVKDASQGGTVMADPRLLEHALVNLLLNACDAAPAGSSVTIDIRHVGQDLSIAVGDEGHGISVEEAARALEPFFTTKSAEAGTGLGLAVAHEIILGHRGSLVLTPRTPCGTLATMKIPLVNPA